MSHQSFDRSDSAEEGHMRHEAVMNPVPREPDDQIDVPHPGQSALASRAGTNRSGCLF